MRGNKPTSHYIYTPSQQDEVIFTASKLVTKPNAELQ